MSVNMQALRAEVITILSPFRSPLTRHPRNMAVLLRRIFIRRSNNPALPEKKEENAMIYDFTLTTGKGGTLNLAARFEPTADMADVEKCIRSLL